MQYTNTRIVRADSAFALGTHGCVVVMVWRGDATMERLNAGTALIATHAVEVGTSVGVVSVIEAGAPPPDAEGIERVAADQRELASIMWGFAVVMEDPEPAYVMDAGYAMDDVRGVPLKLRHCADAREATAWLVSQCPPSAQEPPTREGLLEAIAQVRSAIG